MTHRLPSILAAEALTVDHISDGRLELAVGAAWNAQEHRALGIGFPPASERLDRLEEGVQVLRLLLTTDDATFEGRYFSLDRATLRPRPVQRPYPPLWIGGTGRRRTLPIAGRYADMWHGWAESPQELAEINAIVDRAAEEADRNPSDVGRASSLSLSQSMDGVRRDAEWMAEGRVGYLVVDWPSEGRRRLDQFIDGPFAELREL